MSCTSVASCLSANRACQHCSQQTPMTSNLGRLKTSADPFCCMTQVQNYIDNKNRVALKLNYLPSDISCLKKRQSQRNSICVEPTQKTEAHAIIFSPWQVIFPHFQKRNLLDSVFTCTDAMSVRKPRKHSSEPRSHQKEAALNNMQKSHLAWNSIKALVQT